MTLSHDVNDRHSPIMIPKVINQIWMTPGEIPEALLTLSQTWMELNPDWDYRLWDSESVEDLLKEHYTDMVPVYESYIRDEQRLNAARYLILHTFGGLYVNMDFECLEPIDRLLGSSECFVGLGLPEESIFCGKPTILGNHFMGCVPNHKFFKDIIDGMITFSNKFGVSHMPYLIEVSTGGLLLANILSTYSDKDKITLIPAELVDPLLKSEITMAMNGMATPEIEQKIEAAFALSYKLFHNS